MPYKSSQCPHPPIKTQTKRGTVESKNQRSANFNPYCQRKQRARFACTHSRCCSAHCHRRNGTLRKCHRNPQTLHNRRTGQACRPLHKAHASRSSKAHDVLPFPAKRCLKRWRRFASRHLLAIRFGQGRASRCSCGCECLPFVRYLER